jgi:hypothetical protein
MIKVPYIMEAFDILTHKNTSFNDIAKRKDLIHLIRSCYHVNAQLLTWHQKLRYELNGEFYTFVPAVAQNPTDDEIRGRVFPFAIQFPTLSAAQLMLLYWSTMLLLYRTIGDIQKLLEVHKDGAMPKTPGQDPPAAQKSLPHPAEISVYREITSGELPLAKCPLYSSLPESMGLFAANICQSVEYCYHSKNGSLGLQSTVFPIWAAQEFYASQPALSREWQWCSEIGNMTAPDSRFDLKVMKLNSGS